MANVFLSGQTGRLGTYLSRCFMSRGDALRNERSAINYMVFAHRYRGAPSLALEMEANVEWVSGLIEAAQWDEGDRSIVLVSSINADEPAAHQSLAYNLSKAALNNMARFYAKTQTVRINSVSPDTFTADDSKVSFGDVANVILFLCSPESAGINGQDIRVTR